MIRCKRCGRKIPLDAVLEHIEVAHPHDWQPSYLEEQGLDPSPSKLAVESPGEKRVSQE